MFVVSSYVEANLQGTVKLGLAPEDASAFQHVGTGSFCEDGGDLLEG